MKFNRKEILRQLESCNAGLSHTDNLEQSDCYILRPGKISTFNEEILCRQDTPLPFQAAVPAKPLVETLRKLTEDEIDIELKESQLLIKCAGTRRIGLNIHADIVLHCDAVEQATEYTDVPPVFADALAMVAEAADKDGDDFALNCIQIKPAGMQATDRFQAIRYKVDCPVRSDVLVKRQSCMAVNGLGIAAMQETDNWIHWKTYTGLQIAVRKYLEEYPNLGPLFKAEPQGCLRLPPSLIDALQKASIFLNDTGTGKQAVLQLKTGEITIRGQNEHGFYEEVREVAYKGPDAIFGINPKYVQNLLKHDYPCELTEGSLRIRGENFAYITSRETVV